LSTFHSNTGISRDIIEKKALIVIVNPADILIDYIIKKDVSRSTGSVDEPGKLESVINSKISEYWDTTDPASDKQVIYVHGNVKTNEFKRVPYYIVFIKDFEIDGLFKKRTATFVGFSASKIERKEQ